MIHIDMQTIFGPDKLVTIICIGTPYLVGSFLLGFEAKTYVIVRFINHTTTTSIFRSQALPNFLKVSNAASFIN